MPPETEGEPWRAVFTYYLDPDRLPVEDRWSRKHARTRRALCERSAAPVVEAMTCQDTTTGTCSRS